MKYHATNLLLGLALPTPFLAQERPNIIYIMTDQQSATAMSCAGNEELHTPNMDRLASHGVRFENAYCSFPLSGPSRSSMFTGCVPGVIGLHENGKPLPDSVRTRTLGTLVETAGYTTAYAGKWHAHTNSLPDKHAFGFENLHGHNDFGLAEAAVDFLKRKHDKPFFLVASFDNPHNICQYARSQKLPFATVEEPDLDECPVLPANFNVAPYDADVLKYEKEQNYRLYPTRNFTPDDWRRYRNAYFRLVETVDREIGKLVDEIDRQDLWKNTVIIFTSDHGDGNGAHQWNQKTALYEEVVNVPLIVCLPKGKQAGKVLPQLVNSGVDLLPSVCDWAGVEVPAGCHGVSYRAVTEQADPQKEHQPYVVVETHFLQTAGTPGWALRTPRYKYVLYEVGKNREMLYDMEKDRGEMCNLAVSKAYKKVLEEHRNLLKEWMKKHPLPKKQDITVHVPVQ
ncbi:sulfatase family protein [Bacteroides uniformis]|uniref:sulfatase family protein n=1 Tax=Bacteroides uniformis TaxID=820 RepID=UPI0021660F46|nr:sulfatase-like hydrolase/transferase [Bacteroides uniformis]MCS2412403.1 sulfatase-like hydrolase/transferase [Bacteroides uniformis]